MSNRVPRLRLLSACLLFFLAFSSAAFADAASDRTHFGHDISVGPDEKVGDVTCFGCSIHVRGHVTSDATAFGGSIIVEDEGQIDGDATIFGGGVRLERQSNVGGDVTVFGGRIHRDSSASVGGDVTNFGGPIWIVLIFGLPLALLGGFIALIVWIVRRLTRPSVPVAA
jgi:hypothetical protein